MHSFSLDFIDALPNKDQKIYLKLLMIALENTNNELSNNDSFKVEMSVLSDIIIAIDKKKEYMVELLSKLRIMDVKWETTGEENSTSDSSLIGSWQFTNNSENGTQYIRYSIPYLLLKVLIENKCYSELKQKAADLE